MGFLRSGRLHKKDQEIRLSVYALFILGNEIQENMGRHTYHPLRCYWIIMSNIFRLNVATLTIMGSYINLYLNTLSYSLFCPVGQTAHHVHLFSGASKPNKARQRIRPLFKYELAAIRYLQLMFGE